MLAAPLRGQVLEATEPTGKLVLYVPREGLGISVVTGHFSTAMVEAWVTTMDPAFERGERFDTFHDWEAMETYDPPARQLLTKWIVQRRGLVRTARFLIGSQVVAAGVSTAAMAAALIGLNLRVSGNRTEFDAALSAALPRAGHGTGPGAQRG